MTPLALSTSEGLSREESLGLLRQMILIRRFEERAAQLYSQQKIRGFLHLYIGQEAVAVGIIASLKREDNVVATYREHGHALARGLSVSAVMAEMYGKQEGVSRGHGGSMHLYDRTLRFFGGNAIVASNLPIAVGLALADKMQNRDSVTVCFFGEGAVAEGAFHESMNLAALWELPVLFCCENNNYAMGTHLTRAESETDLCSKASSYKLESESVDGMKVEEVFKTAKRLLEKIRQDRKPRFLECVTYRFRPHSMFDPELYRDKTEVEEWKKRDPIQHFIHSLQKSQLLVETVLQTIEQEVSAQLDSAIHFAEQGTLEPVEELLKDVTSA